MDFKNKNKLIFIFSIFLLNINLYANIIYDKNDVIISELEAQDIDTDIDWKLAELKFNLINEISR